MTDVWSSRAAAMRESRTHRQGPDLDLVVEWCEATDGVQALDVATGGQHVARRLREEGASVVTVDPAPGMQPDVVARAEDLPFADGTFDVVVTRIAPHHFEDVARAVREMARVSRNLVVVEDTLYADEAVEEAERLRDPTHIRSYSEEEWRRLLEDAGLRIEEVERLEKRRTVDVWLALAGTPEADRERIRRLLGDRVVDGEYVDTKILFKARKR